MSEEIELPHSLEAEQSILGSILKSNELAELAFTELKGDEFYYGDNAVIYETLKKLWDEDVPIELVTVMTELRERNELDNIGGSGYLARLASGITSQSTLIYFLKIIKNRHLSRLIMADAKKRYHEAMNSDKPEQVVASMQEAANAFTDRTAKKNEFHPISEVLKKSYENLENRHASRSSGGTTGIPSGFADLDRMTAGFQKNDLIIVAARPSVGKTAFALNIAQNVGVHTGETIAIFSLEMSATQLVDRMICAESNVDASRMRTGYVEGDDWEKVTMAIGNLSEAQIFIDDTPAINVHDIRAKCRRLKDKHGLGMILIDYLQLIPGRGKRGENRQQEVSEISRTLKQIARELEVPVIALSQLSRGVEQRQDKRPMMSDLRESGAIEQDADIVAFLYRDDYYDKESEKKNIIEIIISKQRNGPVGTVELAFLKQFNKFVSLDRSHHEQKPTLQVVRKPAENKFRGRR